MISMVYSVAPLTKAQFSKYFVHSHFLTHCRLWVKQTRAHPFLLPPLSDKCIKTKVSQDFTVVWMLMSWELSRWMQPKWVSMMSQRDTWLKVPGGPAKILELRSARVSWPDSLWHAPWPHLIEWEQSSWVSLRIRNFTAVCLTVLWRLCNKRDLWVSGVDSFQCEYRWLPWTLVSRLFENVCWFFRIIHNLTNFCSTIFSTFSWARFAPMATLQLLTIEFLYASFGFKSL